MGMLFELVGRMLTLVFNGERVIDRQTIPGITGGALDSDEDKPGVILDYAANGELVGMEILDASTRTDNPRSVDFAVLAGA